MTAIILLTDTIHVASQQVPHIHNVTDEILYVLEKLNVMYLSLASGIAAILMWRKRVKSWYHRLRQWVKDKIKSYLIKHIFKMDPETLQTTLTKGFAQVNNAIHENRVRVDEQYAEIAGLLRLHDGRLSRMEKEILPNGGEHSMSDMLTRLVVDNRLMKNISDYGQFEANSKGEFLFVNDAYCEITGYSREDLLRLGYINTIYEPQREDVRREIDSAIADKRKLEIDYDVQRKDGGLTHVIHRWQPMKKSEKDSDVFGFSGTLNTL